MAEESEIDYPRTPVKCSQCGEDGFLHRFLKDEFKDWCSVCVGEEIDLRYLEFESKKKGFRVNG